MDDGAAPPRGGRRGARVPAHRRLGPERGEPAHRAGRPPRRARRHRDRRRRARWGGYCSDCTRTFAAGDLSDRLAAAYQLVHDAQLAGLRAVAPGIEAKAADAVPRRLIDASEFEGTFGHGLGHGVGLEIHEAPTLRRESHDTLAAGNVVTVEPGIYLPDEGGVRIEDLVIVTEDGCERLSQFPKELRTVG